MANQTPKQAYEQARRLARLQQRFDSVRNHRPAKLLTTAGATPQAIIYLDLMGKIHMELPGLNGARRKADLPADFAERNPELVSELLVQQAQAKRTEVIIRAPARPDSVIEREQRMADFRAEKVRRWNEYIDGLPQAEREAALAKRDKALERANEAGALRARQIWEQTNADHGINLANRVIPANRRPNRRYKITNNVYVNPRHGTSSDETSANAKRRQLAKHGTAIKINLD